VRVEPRENQEDVASSCLHPSAPPYGADLYY
jgi:hypothetical protein